MKSLPVFIYGCPTNYIVYENGQVYSLTTNKFLTWSIDRVGYARVKLTVKLLDGAKISQLFSVHRLVALAFIPNPENKPQVNHIDGNKQHNSVDNLEWVTVSENEIHAFKYKLKIPDYGENSHLAKYKEVNIIKACELMESGKYTLAEISTKVKIPIRTMYALRNREEWPEVTKFYDVENCKMERKSCTRDQIEAVFIHLEEDRLSVYDISDVTGVPSPIILDILTNKKKRKSKKYKEFYNLYDISNYHKKKELLNPLTDEVRAIIYEKSKELTKMDLIDYISIQYKYNRDYIRNYVNRMKYYN